MLNATGGNAVPHREPSEGSGSYTYSDSESDVDSPHGGPAAAAAAPAQVAQPQQHPQQQQMVQPQQWQQQQLRMGAASQQQFSPVSVQNSPQRPMNPKKAQKEAKKEAARAKKEKKEKKKAARMEEGRRGEEDGEDGDGQQQRRRGGFTVPGAARVQALAALATTPANADTQRITIYLFFLFTFVHLLFVILSCVLSQLDLSGGGCYTYWGFKADCDSVSYTIRASVLRNSQMKQNLQAGSAMSILQVLASIALVVVGWLLVIRARVSVAAHRRQRRFDADRRETEQFHDLDNLDRPRRDDGGEGGDGEEGEKSASYINVGNLKWVCLGNMAVDLVLGLIAWAIIAGLYSARPGENKDLPRSMTYGVGFGLGLTMWIVELIMVPIIMFLV